MRLGHYNRYPKFTIRRNPFIQGLEINLIEPEQGKQKKKRRQKGTCEEHSLPVETHLELQ